MKDKILKIVYESLTDALAASGTSLEGELSAETRLYGVKGALDSIALVGLIADIEDRVSQEFDRDIILADERAMSQRLSPFGRVSLLVDYIEKLLQEPA